MIIRRPQRIVSSLELPHPMVLALAAFGAIWLVFQLLGSTQAGLTRWQPDGTPAEPVIAGIAVPFASGTSDSFLPLPSSGPFRQNVAAAIEASNGALQRVVLAPGERWSFNRTVGDPGPLQLATVGGVYGGGWCDLASQYVIALRPLLPPEAIVFPRHRDVAGIGLSGIADEDAVSIWNTNNSGAEQDLVITNTTERPILITASLGDSGVVVRASAQQ